MELASSAGTVAVALLAAREKAPILLQRTLLLLRRRPLFYIIP